nr:Os05g0561000 [Ipomoea batatas]
MRMEKWNGYLQGVTNIDEERVLVRGDRDPSAIFEGDLQACGVIGPDNRDHLWVCVLSKTNQISPTQCLELWAWWIVVYPEATVTFLIPDQPAQHIIWPNLQPLSHHLQQFTGHVRIARNGNGFLGNEFRVGGEEEVLNPTHIAIGPNPPIPITIGGGGPSFVLLMLGQTKEFHSFTFQFSHGLHGNSMVDHLKEPKLLASLHNLGFSLRVQKIYHRNPTKRRRVGFTRFEQREILKNWLRQNHHGYRKNRGKLTTL